MTAVQQLPQPNWAIWLEQIALRAVSSEMVSELETLI
jgi:hypothetical protein